MIHIEATRRREQIVEMLRGRKDPLSATALAAQMGVSRQVIVGDIALLRASGSDIIATARGYITPDAASRSRYIGKVACQHSGQGAVDELCTIVNLGGEVLDVAIDHDVYGEITGHLGLSTRDDVAAFVDRVREKKAKLLSELTDGVHMHAIACRDAATFERIKQALGEKNFLYAEKSAD